MNQTRSELFFGMTQKDGKPVAHSAWHQFQTRVLDTLFDGYTLSHDQGYWKGSRESTYRVIVVHPETRAAKGAVTRAATLWCLQGNQDSVLIVSVPAHVVFLDEDGDAQ